MHMADALVSPQVGALGWCAAGSLLLRCSRQVERTGDDRLIPLMGVMGAFVFASQMINFAIPGTGASGHLGGGLLLAILLGPSAAFLVLASVLCIQALFFADGGLLSLGCNILNIALLPIFFAYPFIYCPIAGEGGSRFRVWSAAIASGVVASSIGALGVVLETVLSGISALPFEPFMLLMLPIHLAIGIMEGFATASILSFLARSRPDLTYAGPAQSSRGHVKPLLISALVIGGVISWFASSLPDGLEWSISKAGGDRVSSEAAEGVHLLVSKLQRATAIFPKYNFRRSREVSHSPSKGDEWPAISPGTSASGIVGGLVTLGIILAAGFALRRYSD